MATRTVQTTPSTTSLSSSSSRSLVVSTSKTTATTTKGSVGVGDSGRPHPLRKRDANREEQQQQQPLVRTRFHPRPQKEQQQQQQQQQKQKQKAKSTKQMRQTSLTSCVRVRPRPRSIAFASSGSSSSSGSSNDSNNNVNNKRTKKEPREDGEEEGDKSKELLGIIVITDDEDEDNAPSSSSRPRKRQHVEEGQPKREDEGQVGSIESQGNNTSSPDEPENKPRLSGGRAVGWEETEPGELLGRLRRDVKELTEQRNSYRHMLSQQQERTEATNKEKKQLDTRVREMELTLSNTKQERRHLAKAKRRIEELEKQVEELEVKATEKQADVALPDMTELEDLVSCEICTMKMWRPATLHECGHTFCESCLHDWFNQTYTQHVEQHPEFLQGPQIPLEYLAHQHIPAYAQEIERMMAAWRAGVVQPVYTCPTCRGRVKSRPLEVFFVRDVVRKVVNVVPRPEGQERERSPELGPNGLNRAVGTIWDGFFPD